jgi:lipopolysaccharide export LptBFGC system permease protein LptF
MAFYFGTNKHIQEGFIMLNSLIVGLGFFVGGGLLVRFLENGEPHLLFISFIVIIFASLNLGIILQKRYS